MNNEGKYETVKLLNGWGVQLNIPPSKSSPEQKLFKRRCYSYEEARLLAEKLNHELNTNTK